MSNGLTISLESELEVVVAALLEFAQGRRKFALSGDLGAGKTALVKAFCKKMGVTENVSSPTFALVNEYVYKNENGQTDSIHHLDLYRLNTLEEALDIGIEDYLFDASYCFIEWPEIIEPLLPNEVVRIKITVDPGEARSFSFSNFSGQKAWP